MKFITEASNEKHIYIDQPTGDIYIFDGTKLIKIGNKKPDIGDRGDQSEIEKEDEERQKQIDKEREEAEANGEDYDDEDEQSLKDRLDRISKMADDDDIADELEREDDDKLIKQRQKAKERESQKYRSSPSTQFQMDLSRFIKKQTSEDRDRSWKVFNKNTIGSGIISRGYVRKDNKNIPKINVYYDQSGSWSPQDIEVGNSMLKVLDDYVRKNKIKVDIYYFSDHVEVDAAAARRQGGTSAGEELLQHINDTKPDNVIVMTDSDFDMFRFRNKPTTVKGAVWFLWKNGDVSRWLSSNLRGLQQTSSYNI